MKVLLIILFHILAIVLAGPLWLDTFWEETTAAGVVAQVETILYSVHIKIGGVVATDVLW